MRFHSKKRIRPYFFSRFSLNGSPGANTRIRLGSTIDTSKAISEIACELGFKYPQHFTRLFKQRVGLSPNEY